MESEKYYSSIHNTVRLIEDAPKDIRETLNREDCAIPCFTEKEFKDSGLVYTPEYVINRLAEYEPLERLLELIAEDDQEGIKKFKAHNKAVKKKHPKKRRKKK